MFLPYQKLSTFLGKIKILKSSKQGFIVETRFMAHTCILAAWAYGNRIVTRYEPLRNPL